ncbi:MAG: glycosyltransferase family 9 protein [Verrucomicrobiae bacterium]|nr:glycosyltransferase family 9 protein [Verrucomicrobiae bacterium]
MKVSDCERILLVKPSSLGDIVHTLPAAAAIARAAPLAKIDWLVNTEWSPLLEGVPFLSRVIPFPRRRFRGVQGLFEARKWAARELKVVGYDLAIDFQGLFRSAWLARQATPSVAGFQRTREGAGLFYRERVDVREWDRCHAVDRNLVLAEALGATVGDPDFVLPTGKVPEGLPGLSGPVVVLHPFSRGAGKSLSAEEVCELCERLAPWKVLLAGVPACSLPETWPANVVNLLGKTDLSGLIYLLRLADWTISVDSGPMHLAAGISDRILSIHTWSNPAMVGPRRPGAWVFRDSRILRVGDLDPEAFPERRALALRFHSRARLLDPGDLERIADHVRCHIGTSGDVSR